MLRRTALLLWGLLLLPAAQAQERVGDWQIFTSILNVQALAYRPGELFAATNGGVIRYTPASGELSTLDWATGLKDSDILSLALDGDWLWLGSAAPEGLIQTVYLPTNEVAVIDLQLGAVTHLVASGNRALAAFANGQQIGLVELRRTGSRYEYFDIYRNLPGSPAQIRDLDLYGDSLFVTTEAGVFGNDLRRANLKDPFTWETVVAADTLNILQFLVDSTGHYVLTSSGLYGRVDGAWSRIYRLNSAAPRHMSRRSNGDFLVAVSNLLWSIDVGGTFSGSPRLEGQVMAFIDAPDQLGGFAALRDHGLAFYNYDAEAWTLITPNTPAGRNYTALIKLDNGDLVAAGSRGLTRFNGRAWYNIVPGLTILPKVFQDRIHGGSQVAESSVFLADTLAFRGKQVWNLVALPDGDILTGFRGNPPQGVGVMRLDFEDVGSHIDFDTTGGILDGLSGDGFITIRHMVLDSLGNVWVSNPFGELTGNALAVYGANGQWNHFPRAASGGALSITPTEIAIDDQNRVWIANEANTTWGSTGDIAVLDYGGSLSERSDDTWTRLSVRVTADGSRTVWSLAFDHNGVLWVVTPSGVMGYNVLPDLALEPALDFGAVLTDVPFSEGSKIRVDAENNKWIITPTEGLWVLLDDGTFWPSVDGLSAANSPLPSNEVLDIALDSREGLAYLVTSKGIAVLKIPFRDKISDYSQMIIFPSPYRIPADRPLVVSGIRQGSTVKIFTVSGSLVRELTGLGGGVEGYQALWDGRNAQGEWVGSGVYLVAAYLENGRTGVGKVAVIRR